MSELNPQRESIAARPRHKRSKSTVALWTIVAIAALLGAWGFSAHMSYLHQMEAIAHVERLGGSVGADAPEWLLRLRPGTDPFGPEPLGPNWLRECLPIATIIDHSLTVEQVSLDNGPGLRMVGNYSGEYQDVHPIVVSDDDLRLVARFPNLKRLYLRETQVGDAGLNHLQNLSQIRHLYISFTQITDASMDVIARFENLEMLRLVGTQVTDAGLAKLTRLKHLEELDVRQTKVTEAGLKAFRGRPGLNLIVDDPEDPALLISY